MRLSCPSAWLVLTVVCLLAPGAASADEQGERLLQAACQQLHRARAFSADLETTAELPGEGTVTLGKGKVSALKPNFLRVKLNVPDFQWVADGKSYFSCTRVQVDGKMVFYRFPLSAGPTRLEGVWADEINAFFGGLPPSSKRRAIYLGTQQSGGVECDLVEVQDGEPRHTKQYAIGQTDRLIRRATFITQGAAGPVRWTNTLTNIRLDQPAKPAHFRFTPGKTVQVMPPPKPPELLGHPAPAFSLKRLGGGNLSLPETLHGKKAVLLNFWHYA